MRSTRCAGCSASWSSDAWKRWRARSPRCGEWSPPAPTPSVVLGAIDELLHGLGALRFSAQPMDVVDPLIHAVVEERRAAGVPPGVILEAVRPGFRSGRGLVLARAAVAVSGG